MLDKLEVNDRKLEDIAERVHRSIRRQCGPSAPPFSVTTNLCEEMGFDNIDRMTLACEIEEEFNVLLSDDVVDTVATVQDVIDAVALAIGEKEQEADRG